MYTHDYLIHHGRDGQKWGKRNGPPYPLSRKDTVPKQYRGISGMVKKHKNKKKMAKVRAAKEAKQKEANKKTDEFKSREAKNLSSEALLNRIKRLEQEQRYKQLLKNNRSVGKAMVEDALSNAGKKAIESAATYALIYVGKQAVAKAFNAEPGSDKYKELFSSGGGKSKKKK